QLTNRIAPGGPRTVLCERLLVGDSWTGLSPSATSGVWATPAAQYRPTDCSPTFAHVGTTSIVDGNARDCRRRPRHSSLAPRLQCLRTFFVRHPASCCGGDFRRPRTTHGLARIFRGQILERRRPSCNG